MGKSTKKTESSGAGAPATTAAMMALNPVAVATWLEAMTESMRFVTDRFQQDLETQKAMLDCKNPAELLRIQSEFCQKAIEQYTDEATRMAGIISRATEKSIAGVNVGKSREFDDIPL